MTHKTFKEIQETSEHERTLADQDITGDSNDYEDILKFGRNYLKRIAYWM